MSEQNYSPIGSLVAAALVTQAEPAPAPVFSGQTYGFSAVSSTASGITKVDLGPNSHIAVEDRVVIVTPSETVGVYIGVQEVDESTLNVLSFNDGGVQSSFSFHIAIFRKGVKN